MAIDPHALLEWRIPEVTQTVTPRDAMLYALGLGCGADPCDPSELPFVYEAELRVLPTMAVVLCYPGQWHAAPGTGITSSHVVQGSQWFRIHEPLAVPCTVRGEPRITAVHDKGAGRGAIVVVECEVRDAADGRLLCTIGTSHFCRADGGCGSTASAPEPPPPMPSRAPDAVCDIATLPQAALLYRLSGDYNPLHADPERARRAGFDRPILHGRCTFGIAGRALLATMCGNDVRRLTAMEARFVAPVLPGETIATQLWREPEGVRFRSTVNGRMVLDHGRASCS